MKSNNKTNKDKTPHLFSIACFSTDLKDYSPITIIKKYLHLEQCSNVKCGKEEIEFDHSSNAASGRMTRCKLYEISNISQKNSKCDFVDSYIIFINLEGNEVYNQMDSFISYINNFGKKELKIYLIGMYKNIENVGELNKKKEIKEYLESQNYNNCIYNEVNYDSSNELVEKLGSAINETLKNKVYEHLNQSSDVEIEAHDQSSSKCIIF